MSNERKQCELCGNTGFHGAKWLVRTKDGKTVRVHKPCGEQLVASAPAEVEAKLVPSQELKAEWTAKRTERQAQDFWREKCPQLLKIRERLEPSAGATPEERECVDGHNNMMDKLSEQTKGETDMP